MRKLSVRFWALVKIAYFSLCFVVGIAVMVIAFAVMLVSLGRVFLPRI